MHWPSSRAALWVPAPSAQRALHATRPSPRLWGGTRIAKRRPISRQVQQSIDQVFAAARVRFDQKIVRPPIVRAIAFFAGISTVTLLGCAAWSVAKTESLGQDISAGFWTPVTSLLSNQNGAQRLAMAADKKQVQCINHALYTTDQWLQVLPRVVREPILRFGAMTGEWYTSLPNYQQAAAPIVFINALVFAAWLVGPRLRTTAWMTHNATHRPASGLVFTMLTSVFSHKAPMHFLFNNVALWSVGGSALTGLAVLQAMNGPATVPEATALPQFVAFFVSAGTFASLASHLVIAVRWRIAAETLRISSRNLTRAMSTAKVRFANQTRNTAVQLALLAQRASLGASGAIYAAFMLSACAFPQASLSIIFLPFTAIPIQWGMAGLVTLDIIGIVRGWQAFDHVAHLGGALFGLFYYIGLPRT
ncbi:hypothetical protein MVES_000583 [Malassezia vespertilionis]|uniref:Peptidase S54 rhomboid domain-containing protein n=1 Tax=Malassezia vespertilionis TaxID=2020962 RepID=A0A2N1JG08_9BASI|nr:hypothetical protein MVES_000583 [Malassezia vespertilionis]